VQREVTLLPSLGEFPIAPPNFFSPAAFQKPKAMALEMSLPNHPLGNIEMMGLGSVIFPRYV